MDEALRRFVRDRAGNRCEYCRLPQDAAPFLRFHVEHIQASQHVQDDSESNLCLACPRCNLQKGPNLSTLIGPDRRLVRLFHPREDSWDEHFEIVDGRIVGKTDIGTATARLLLMNADDQLRIRRMLIQRREF
ncbi:MAG: HNH endonuclease [Planctomycetaceae bacterium]|nr:HNH endonuclease [Planctomycetaceae bacterium]